MAAELRRRPLWLTVPMYLLALSVAALNVWAVTFWSAVGASIGLALAVGAGIVSLILTALVGIDSRRQWVLSRFAIPEEEGDEMVEDRPGSASKR